MVSMNGPKKAPFKLSATSKLGAPPKATNRRNQAPNSNDTRIIKFG